jgi:hypothetical protein
MLLRFGEGDRLKNWLKGVNKWSHTRSPKADIGRVRRGRQDDVSEDSEPTDFFDPEEFGSRRRDFPSRS